MKRSYLIFTVMGLIALSNNNRSFAQDKQADFKLGDKNIIYSMEPCGEDEFYVVYGQDPYKLQMRIGIGIPSEKLNIMKFDKNLRPAWAMPVTYEVIQQHGTKTDDITYSYTNATDKKTVSYIYNVAVQPYLSGITSITGTVGQETFLQILPDGTAKSVETGIPKKELPNITAVFADKKGFNIITTNGEKDAPTGNMNWYTYSHDQLKMTKKTIILPLPPVKDNSADWWLNKVTPDGLYFRYIAYKNKVSEAGPILTCYLIKVNNEGKPGNIISIDMGCNAYNIVPACYTQNTFLTQRVGGNVNGSKITQMDWRINKDFNLFVPRIKKYNPNIGFNSVSLINWYKLTEAMGVIVDESNNRIYTFVALNNDQEVNKTGEPKHRTPIQLLKATVFDMSGKKINQEMIDCKELATNPQKIMQTIDNWNEEANYISLNLLQNNEGVVCKGINNHNGCVFIQNKDGKVEKQNKFKLFYYKYNGSWIYMDKYPACYKTKKDFENSPYLNTNSPEAQFFNKIDEDSEPDVSYLSLKSGDVFTVVDSKNKIVKFSYFNKK